MSNYRLLIVCCWMAWMTPRSIAATAFPELEVLTTNMEFGYHHLEDHYFVLLQDSLWILPNREGAVWEKRAYRYNDLGDSHPVGKFYQVKTDSTIYLVDEGVGLVYEYREMGLRRLDHSYSHNNQYGAAMFGYEGQVMAYGGYGLFSHKPFLTSFSTISGEWDLWLLDPRGPIPEARHGMTFFLDTLHHQFYIAGGFHRARPQRQNTLQERLNDVWRLDLRARRWKRLGVIPEHEEAPRLRDWCFSYDNIRICMDQYSFCAVDFPNNRYTYFSGSNLGPSVAHSYFPDVNPRDRTLILAMWTDNAMTTKFTIRILDQELFVTDPIRSGRIFRPVGWWRPYALAALVALLLLVGGYLRARANGRAQLRFSTRRRTIYYRNRKLPFQPEHLELLFFLHAAGDFVTNQALLEHLGNSNGQDQSEGAKKRKTRIIQDINEIVHFATGRNLPLIEERKDPADQRYKEYRLHQEWV